MVEILIRDVADEVFTRLQTLARAQGKSVSDVALDALRSFMAPSQAEFLDIAERISAMGPRFPGSSVDLIRDDRDSDDAYR
ncbi:hypothetical protein [Salinarimonas rosea]|uniref:hypothetical protein n=1 Tax=Salinarimonas rosea TaxID=552063 RepID=UPI00040872AF|nr:hypothetical protein [Salinarimonas rosea]